MNPDLYPMIFRRKSFHLFRGTGNDRLAPDFADEIQKAFAAFEPLIPEIRTAVRVVPAGQVNFKRDAEACILIYSEKKENYLMNAGYLGEQLDLWLVLHRIGSLWYGLGKPDEKTFDGLDFVIMIAVRKVDDDRKFRTDMFRAKRKPLDEIWSGDPLGVGEIARFSPSACNSQPWFVENSGGQLTVSRLHKQSRVGILSPAAASYFNRIDMGIFLCILELCLGKNGIAYNRTLCPDTGGDAERTKAAVYRIG